VFKDGDPRYALTTWIRSNIPKNSKIEVFDQLGDVASESLFYDYEILYLGNNSKVDSSKNFFYWLKAPHRIPHLNHIRDHGSDADYIIFSHHNLSDFLKKKEPPLSQSYIPYVITYIQNLFANKTDFRLIQKFEYINKKKESQFLKGFYHFENLWWYPAPSSRETTRSLYLFKKMIAN
ncbi:MAG: hypothetical protein HYS98_04960, partial [Deltaproteobacteria bacterium]|nr:hypothetical protein [Deltaproteobacteria bacterium]